MAVDRTEPRVDADALGGKFRPHLAELHVRGRSRSGYRAALVALSERTPWPARVLRADRSAVDDAWDLPLTGDGPWATKGPQAVFMVSVSSPHHRIRRSQRGAAPRPPP